MKQYLSKYMTKEQDINKMWAEYKLWAKYMLKTVRPWQVRGGATVKGETGEYFKGWNACLKQMKKNEAKWFKNMEDFIK